MSNSQLEDTTIQELSYHKSINQRKLDLWKKRTSNNIEYELIILNGELTLIYALKNKKTVKDKNSFKSILSEAINETIQTSDLIDDSYNKLMDNSFNQPIIRKYTFDNKRVNIGLIDVRIKQLLEKKKSLQTKLESLDTIYDRWVKNLDDTTSTKKIEIIRIN